MWLLMASISLAVYIIWTILLLREQFVPQVFIEKVGLMCRLMS